MNKLRKECWEKVTRQEKIEIQDATNVQEVSNENENAFVTRATHSTLPSARGSNDYLPPSAYWITLELRKNYEGKLLEGNCSDANKNVINKNDSSCNTLKKSRVNNSLKIIVG